MAVARDPESQCGVRAHGKIQYREIVEEASITLCMASPLRPTAQSPEALSARGVGAEVAAPNSDAVTAPYVAEGDHTELHDACASADLAKRQSDDLWRAMEAKVDSETFSALKLEGALGRATAEAELAQRQRTILWELVRDSTDAQTYANIARNVRGGCESAPALPVGVVRKLFEAEPLNPDVGSASRRGRSGTASLESRGSPTVPEVSVLNKAAAYERTASANSSRDAELHRPRADSRTKARPDCTFIPAATITPQRPSLPPRPPTTGSEGSPPLTRRRSECPSLVGTPPSEHRGETCDRLHHRSPSVRDRIREIQGVARS
mmetsp:Transcript_46237/g.122622  ORF Transcript_46237/g.122622 Transcript_46237/m.122622 type:complete len:322 (-) Transcript_46237:130-1095(-)